jgi:hypothetical protein
MCITGFYSVLGIVNNCLQMRAQHQPFRDASESLCNLDVEPHSSCIGMAMDSAL